MEQIYAHPYWTVIFLLLALTVLKNIIFVILWVERRRPSSNPYGQSKKYRLGNRFE